MSYLWMVGLVMRLFFLWGQPLKIIRRYSAKKGPAPWNLFLTPVPRPLQVTFFGWWSWTYVVVAFCKDKCIFSKKNLCFGFWARVDTKFLNLSHHVLSVDGWPGDATFFLWGQPLKIIRRYSAKKGPAPWNLFLTPVPRPLQVTFFGWWSWTYVVVAFCKDKCMFSKKNLCFGFWARVGVDTKFLNLSRHFLSMDGWPGDATFFLWGQPLKIIRMYSAKKRSRPLEFIFDTCA